MLSAVSECRTLVVDIPTLRVFRDAGILQSGCPKTSKCRALLNGIMRMQRQDPQYCKDEEEGGHSFPLGAVEGSLASRGGLMSAISMRWLPKVGCTAKRANATVPALA